MNIFSSIVFYIRGIFVVVLALTFVSWIVVYEFSEDYRFDALQFELLSGDAVFDASVEYGNSFLIDGDFAVPVYFRVSSGDVVVAENQWLYGVDSSYRQHVYGLLDQERVGTFLFGSGSNAHSSITWWHWIHDVALGFSFVNVDTFEEVRVFEYSADYTVAHTDSAIGCVLTGCDSLVEGQIKVLVEPWSGMLVFVQDKAVYSNGETAYEYSFDSDYQSELVDRFNTMFWHVLFYILPWALLIVSALLLAYEGVVITRIIDQESRMFKKPVS